MCDRATVTIRRTRRMLHISVLGEQAVRRGPDLVRTRSSRTLELVAYLAAHTGVPQSRQRIAGLFWPDSGDEQALTNLRRELHHLRQLLGAEPALEVTARALCWHDCASCVVDVRDFDRHCAAAFAADDDADALTHATCGHRVVPRRAHARQLRRLAGRPACRTRAAVRRSARSGERDADERR